MEYRGTLELNMVQFHTHVRRHFHPCIIAIVENRAMVGWFSVAYCLFAKTTLIVAERTRELDQ